MRISYTTKKFKESFPFIIKAVIAFYVSHMKIPKITLPTHINEIIT